MFRVRYHSTAREEKDKEDKMGKEENHITLKKLLGFLRSSNIKIIRKICFGASNSIFEAMIARPTCQDIREEGRELIYISIFSHFHCYHTP
jgi:hypothetical protein